MLRPIIYIFQLSQPPEKKQICFLIYGLVMQPADVHVHCFCLFLMSFTFIMLSAVELLDWAGKGAGKVPYDKNSHSSTALCALIKRLTNSTLAADDRTVLLILAM